jgi:hypothetical protein
VRLTFTALFYTHPDGRTSLEQQVPIVECRYANIHSTDELVVLIVVEVCVDFGDLGELGWMEGSATGEVELERREVSGLYEGVSPRGETETANRLCCVQKSFRPIK